MLSHYADRHRGWMIEFELNTKILYEQNGMGFVDLKSPKIPSYGYNDRPTDIDRFTGKIATNHLTLTKYEKDEAIASIIGTKMKRWEYEEELRLIVSWPERKIDGHEDLKFKDCGLTLKTIYYGREDSESDRYKIRKIIDAKNANIDDSEKIKIAAAIRFWN